MKIIGVSGKHDNGSAREYICTVSDHEIAMLLGNHREARNGMSVGTELKISAIYSFITEYREQRKQNKDIIKRLRMAATALANCPEFKSEEQVK